jgi:uncharacterized peroxidase-related enzyme
MAHIDLDNDIPGIRGLFTYRPDTGAVLSDLGQALLRGDSTLSRGERELIATYVSHLNECRYCAGSHGACAAAQLPGGSGQVEATLDNPEEAPVSARVRALIGIAARVQESGRSVTEKDVAAAQAEGATDREIHDTVLIAAASWTFNRQCRWTGAPPHPPGLQRRQRAAPWRPAPHANARPEARRHSAPSRARTSGRTLGDVPEAPLISLMACRTCGSRLRK